MFILLHMVPFQQYILFSSCLIHILPFFIENIKKGKESEDWCKISKNVHRQKVSHQMYLSLSFLSFMGFSGEKVWELLFEKSLTEQGIWYLY